MDFKDAYLKILTKIYLNVICIHIVDFCRPSYIWYHTHTHTHTHTHIHTYTHTYTYTHIHTHTHTHTYTNTHIHTNITDKSNSKKQGLRLPKAGTPGLTNTNLSLYIHVSVASYYVARYIIYIQHTIELVSPSFH